MLLPLRGTRELDTVCSAGSFSTFGVFGASAVATYRFPSLYIAASVPDLAEKQLNNFIAPIGERKHYQYNGDHNEHELTAQRRIKSLKMIEVIQRC